MNHAQWLYPSLLMASALSMAEVSVSEKYQYYVVFPESKSAIARELLNKSPIKENDQVFFGYAHSYIRWHFNWKYNSERCWITSVSTVLETTYTLPELGNNVPSVNNVWRQWFPNLERHEKGHHEIAVSIAERIDQKILTMPAYPNCRQLEQKANQIGHGLIAEMDKLNKKYDQDTNHGETEGAFLSSYR